MARAKGKSGDSSGPKSTESNKQLIKFPLKPARNKEAPGIVVKLRCNLLYLSLKQNKRIYKYATSIDEVLPEGAEKRKFPRKLNNELKRTVVKSAIEQFIRNQPSQEYVYVMDTNGSVVYTLFDMFPNSVETKLRQVIPYINKRPNNETKKLDDVEEKFIVTIIKNDSDLKVKDLFDNCQKSNLSFDITKFREYIRAINVLVHAGITTIPSNVVTKTSVFPFAKDNRFDLSPGVFFNRGYALSVRPSESGLLLNVANTGKAFYEAINLTDMLKTRFEVKDLDAVPRAIIDNLKREIVTKQVEATHLNYGSKEKPHYRKYRVSGISSKSSSEEKFELEDKATGKKIQMTVAAYFKQEYGFNVKYPKLPCIESNGRKIPLEICRLVEKQGVVRKMTPNETATIIKRQANPPGEHFRQIEERIVEIKSNTKELGKFGVDLKADLVKVDGREIKPFSLIGGNNEQIIPSNGQYDVRRSKFFKPVFVKTWKLAFFGDQQFKNWCERNSPNSDAIFADRYKNEASKKGVRIGEPQEVDKLLVTNPEELVKKSLRELFVKWNKERVEHVIIILADRAPDWMYRYIQYFEATVPDKSQPNSTRTSCIKFSNYDRKIINSRDQGAMFIANLWLKHNTKLRGVNFVLSQNNKEYNKFLQDGYIFLSVDVCHPAPGDRLIQSVAAVVGMWDLTNANISYCTRMRVQRKMRPDHSTIEEVGEIGTMITEVLKDYFAKKKKLPSKVVILRDGVSEGQFAMVLGEELKRVNESLSKLYVDKKQPMPPITCFTVQKRHRIRFKREIPVNTNKGVPDYNIQPGTVVDSTVTHPTDFEFYLAPHKAIQGTSKPPRFYCIQDQIGFNQDEAQAMMHALSYLSPRCTKSTSIPTPVNLADLAAERGKNLVICWQEMNLRRGDKSTEDEVLIKLNSFLDTIGDVNYRHYLYYV